MSDPTWFRDWARQRVARTYGHFWLIYDGDCGFCRAGVRRVRLWLGEAPVRYRPCQEPSLRADAPQLAETTCLEAVTLIDPDGWVYQGADLLPKLWQLQHGSQCPAAWWRLPGLMPLLRAGYRLLANHRQSVSQILGTVDSPPLA